MKEVKMLPCHVTPADMVVFNIQPKAEPRQRHAAAVVVALPVRSGDSEPTIESEEWVFDTSD